MCGIVGWINLNENISGHSKIMETMTERLRNRGPDASGIWASENALIGHRRLSIIDLEGGRQPMSAAKDQVEYIISYNGELYNTREVRNELISLGHIFSTNCDTEVVLRAFIEWGACCLEKFNGIFAFAIWNNKNKSLFLARDRLGVKPLFYTQHGKSIIFASEIKSILAHPDIKPIIDRNGLAEIFTLGPSRTPGCGVFKSICELKPGYCLSYDISGIHIKQYWRLKSKPHTDDLNDTMYKVAFLLKDAITRQLVSDVPVCTFLSGGLDSSAVSAIASMYLEMEKKEKLHTYSVDYVDNEKFFTPSDFQPDPDSQWIGRVSEQFGTIHKYVKFDTDAVVHALQEALYARDLPGMADIDSSLLLFCQVVKNDGFVVALSGECADEVFGGYPWFHRSELINCSTFPWMRHLEERLKILAQDVINSINPYQYIANQYKKTIEEVPYLEGESIQEAKKRQICYLTLQWFMSTLLDRKDRMSMASGLEVRVPFCDHRIVEYVWNIPWSMKMLHGREKGLLREVLRGTLTDDVVSRKKSPYPKTHNPSYEKAVKDWFFDMMEGNNAPIYPLIDMKVLKDIAIKPSNYGNPWFGQLMAIPQMFAYLIQVNMWLRDYDIELQI